MSWLYSIFLAGLAFSSSSSPVNLNAVAKPDNAVVTARADETEHFDQTYPLTSNGKVNLSNVNGSVTVEAWDRNEVHVEYTKTADSKERLNDVNVRIDSRADGISIDTDYDNWKRDNNNDHGWKFSGKLEVAFKLTVPRGAMLNEIETVNGSVDVADFTNYTKVSAVNGSVNARNIRGTARLSTVNGEVHADFDRLETGSRISLDTVNGHVNLSIPSDSNATVKADSLNGSITNDWNLPVRKGKYVGRDLYGKLGSGDVQIKLSSVNGQLAIGRKNDGRQLSPATNLLPEKGKDDDDWDTDMDIDADVNTKIVKIDKEKINKQIRQSMQQSQREMIKAQTAVQTEMANVGPQIAKAVAETAAAGALIAANQAEIQRSIQDAMRSVNVVYMPGVPRVETKSNTFTMRGVPTVTIEGSECAVKVTGWDRSDVQYRVVQFSNARRDTPLKVTDNHTDTSVDIKVEDPDEARRAASYFDSHERTRIEVMVPKKSNLHIKANGEIRLDGVSGELDVTGGGSSVNVRDSDGTLQVTTNDGRIRVIGFRGDVNAISGDAPISLEGEFASLSAKAGDSPVNVVLPANASADLESNCASVVGDGIPLTKVSSKDERSTYRIGAGGGHHFLIESDGGVSIRSTDTIARVE
jgi:hypothetical protein